MGTQRMTKVAAVVLILGLARGATADWVTSGNNMYSNVSGNVGIGTTSPRGKLEVRSSSTSVSPLIVWGYNATTNTPASTSYGGISFSNEVDTSLAIRSLGSGHAQIATDASGRYMSFATGAFQERMRIDQTGNVGIGTSSPQGKLDVLGQLMVSGGANLVLKAAASDAGDIVFQNSAGAQKGLIWTEPSAGNSKLYFSSTDNIADITIDHTGGVGIGTSNPAGKLDVAGNIVINNGSADGARIVWKGGSGGTKEYRARVGGGGELAFFPGEGQPSTLALWPRDSAGAGGGAAITGNVEIYSPVTGLLTVAMGDGYDYAEGFDLSEKDKPSPGTVLRIDPEHPGQLAVSKEAYDTNVAGIVAGAKGLGSGVRLGSNEFDADVALAGRVYCNVDATEAAVKPGDLLTTSSTPGYAMKALDRTRAQGATLGKAMEKLEKGQKGQILVLVTLQ
jgi:hypothetical protein